MESPRALAGSSLPQPLPGPQQIKQLGHSCHSPEDNLSHPSLLWCCHYFRQNRTLEMWAAHFKGQEVRQSACMPSDTVGMAEAIYLALFFMHILRISLALLSSHLSTLPPSLSLQLIFPLLPGISCTHFLIQSWTFVFFLSFFQRCADNSLGHNSDTNRHNHHSYGAYIWERWGEMENKE